MSEADTATGQHTPPTQDGPTQCVQCGAAMGRNDRFCRSCGASRTEDATVVSHVSLRNAQAAQLMAATEGEFEILERIGHGAMGAVYVAKDVALGRQVAIKVIAPHLLADPSMVSRFKLEAQTVASLRHPNIVNIHGVREADELHYFVMEYIDGPTLRSLVKRHAPLDFEVVRSVLYQVGSALNYAHQAGRGVIHRDIKPANIMLNREGDSFLTDFGISKITEVKTGLTQTGATIGTPEYMSPEQCRGEELTGASDQYALGIVAYEMICGATPFSGTQYSVMVAHAQEPPEPIRASRPDCPQEVAEAVERMLSKAPAERWPDLDAAVEAMGGRPMGFKDPIRSKIVHLIESSEAAAGADTVPPSEAPTELTAPPAVDAPSGPGRAAAAQGDARPGVDSPPTSPERDPTPSPTPGEAASSSGGGRRLLPALALVAILAAVFLGGRAFLFGGGAPLEDPFLPASVDTGDPAASGDADLLAGGPTRASTDEAPDDPGGPATGGGQASGTPTNDAEEDAPVGTPTETSSTPPPSRELPADPVPSRAEPASVTIRVTEQTMRVGDQALATATVRTTSGAPITSPAISWSSGDPRVVTVDGAGVLSARGEGTAWVVADVAGIRDSVEVAAAAVVSGIRVDPDAATLDVGDTRRLTATVLGADGAALPRAVNWSSSDAAVLPVSADGEVRAAGAGTAVVTASTEGVEGTATFSVRAAAPPPPSAARLTAEIERYLALFTTNRDGALALWPEGTGDDDLREELAELLGRDELTATLEEQSPPSLAGQRATATFVASVTHRGNFGRDRSGTVAFRVELMPSASGWALAAVRAERFDGF